MSSIERGVLNSEFVTWTNMIIFRTDGGIMIIEVPLIQGYPYREVPLTKIMYIFCFYSLQSIFDHSWIW